MIRALPYSDPEYLRQLRIVPYDYEADMANERFRQQQASLAYRVALAQVIREKKRRAVVKAILFVVTCFVLGFLGACL